MKITDKINFKQPKYILPAIIYLPILATAYFVFDMFNTELADVTPTNLETTEYLNDKMPTAQIKDELGGKYENMLKSYGKIEDYSAVENIERGNEGDQKEAYDSRYKTLPPSKPMQPSVWPNWTKKVSKASYVRANAEVKA